MHKNFLVVSPGLATNFDLYLNEKPITTANYQKNNKFLFPQFKISLLLSPSFIGKSQTINLAI